LIKETNKLKIYLGGSADEIEYRKEVHQKYENQFRIIDPLKETPHDLGRNLIVEMDKRLILESDIFVAFIKKFTCGTIMEILFAYENNIPIYVINSNSIFLQDIWLSYHTNIFFNNINECFEYIREK